MKRGGQGRIRRRRARQFRVAVAAWHEFHEHARSHGPRHYGRMAVAGVDVEYAYHGDPDVRPLIEELVRAAAAHLAGGDA